VTLSWLSNSWKCVTVVVELLPITRCHQPSLDTTRSPSLVPRHRRIHSSPHHRRRPRSNSFELLLEPDPLIPEPPHRSSSSDLHISNPCRPDPSTSSFIVAGSACLQNLIVGSASDRSIAVRSSSSPTGSAPLLLDPTVVASPQAFLDRNRWDPASAPRLGVLVYFDFDLAPSFDFVSRATQRLGPTSTLAQLPPLRPSPALRSNSFLFGPANSCPARQHLGPAQCFGPGPDPAQ
jgi:hypothetical protein